MESTETYDPSNPKYKCCCGCHVTTGTKIICWVYCLVYILVVIQRAVNFPHLPMIFVGAVIVPLSILIFSTGLYAVKKEKPLWLIPLLIALIISIIFSIAENIYAMFTFLTERHAKMFPFEDAYFSSETRPWPFQTAGSDQFLLVFVFLIARLLINIAFYSWLFFIVFRCYQYFTAKNNDVKLPSHQRYF